jgi:MYXO-CTERM domain-containing protein
MDNDNWGGNANGANGFGALAQAFELNSAGTLANVQMAFAGSEATFNVELYDLGTVPAGYQAAPGNAPTITQINKVGLGGAGGVNLLQSGDSFTFYGVASNQTLQTLTFGDGDANVQLVTGELYVLSLDPKANADNTWWDRGGIPVAAYNTGEGLNADGVDGLQNFEGKTNVRDFDLAVDVLPVPEPSTWAMAAMGIGALVGRRILRRRSS